jgi:hypothetical protein
LFILFVFLKNNTSSSTTITPIPPTQPPPPSIVGPENPIQQNPSAPGGGVIIGPGKGIGQAGPSTMPIHSTLTYLFPVMAETARASFIDTVDRAAHGDFPTKKDVKQGFVNDYTYALPIQENLRYHGNTQVAKKAFSHRLDTWMDDVMSFFY